MKHNAKYLLDGTTEVILIKSFFRSLSKYLVATQTDTFLLVESGRLTPVKE